MKIQNCVYSIIIPTLNQSSKLNKCLFHLSELSFDPDLFEVLIVDNGSTDNTKEVSQSFSKNIQNLYYHFCLDPGLMAARHMGCDKAQGDILCFIDDDSLVDKDWLQGIADAFSDKDVALVGGPCIPEYEIVPPYWAEYFWHSTEYGKANGLLSLIDFGSERIDINPGYVFGCNYSIRKRIFLELGGTHPDYLPGKYKFFQGDGEGGLSGKIYASGYKTIYDPRVKIRHLIPRSRLTVEYFCWRRYFNGIHTSYSTIRKEHGLDVKEIALGRSFGRRTSFLRKVAGLVKRRLKTVKGVIIPSEPKQVRKIRKKISESFEEGFRFHQEAVKKDPKLLEWVLRKNYLGEKGRLPE